MSSGSGSFELKIGIPSAFLPICQLESWKKPQISTALPRGNWLWEQPFVSKRISPVLATVQCRIGSLSNSAETSLNLQMRRVIVPLKRGPCA